MVLGLLVAISLILLTAYFGETPRNPQSDNNGFFNACGIPAISIPCGFTRDGLPIGLQIAGPHFSVNAITSWSSVTFAADANIRICSEPSSGSRESALR